MIIFISGKDTFRSREHLHKLMQKFRTDRDQAGYNTVQIDCEKSTAGQILEQVAAAPFLAERRMVILERLLTSKQTDVIETLTKKVTEKSFPDFLVLIFWEANDTWKMKVAKILAGLLKKEKFAQQFDLLKGMQLNQWIISRVIELGGSIDSVATMYLATNEGKDMWCMANRIDQLLAYKNGEKITQADVGLFVSEVADDNIFNLVDAIITKRGKYVYNMIYEQYANGKDTGYIFAMVLRQFRILLELRDLFERNDNMQSDQLAKALNLHPFVVKKSLPLVRQYSMQELTDIYEQLLSIDIKTKTGQADQSLLLDMFVGRVVE